LRAVRLANPKSITISAGEFKQVRGTPIPIHVTPLHASVFKDHAPATRLLLSRRADPSIADSLNVTPLMKAAYMDLQEQLRMLLDAGAELEAVEPITGHTAFLWACHDGKVDCAEMLVRAGCNSSHRNKAGLTGRDIAQQRGHPAVVERLRAVVVEQLATRASSHGIAIEDEPEPAIDIEPDAAIDIEPDAGGATLHSAAGAGDTATISQLLDEGCDINALTDGWSALQMAVMLNQLPAAQLLLNRGADPSTPNSLGITPVIMASGESHDHCCQVCGVRSCQHCSNNLADRQRRVDAAAAAADRGRCGARYGAGSDWAHRLPRGLRQGQCRLRRGTGARRLQH